MREEAAMARDRELVFIPTTIKDHSFMLKVSQIVRDIMMKSWLTNPHITRNMVLIIRRFPNITIILSISNEAIRIVVEVVLPKHIQII
jgi:hypothetical protein